MIKIDDFRFVEVDSDRLKEAVFRLRYKVFSAESNILKPSDYERPEDFEAGLERDVFDNHAIHFAALNEHDEVVGALRLVLHSEEGFPIHRWARNLSFVGDKPQHHNLAEISRLAVSRRYRRRQEDGFYGVESYLMKKHGGVLPDDGSIPKEHERRKRPVIVLGLYRIMYHASKRRNISHWYLITEVKLFHALKKYGFVFHQIGKPVEYHGMRTPYLGVVEEMERQLAARRPEVLQLMLNGLEEEYHPAFLNECA